MPTLELPPLPSTDAPRRIHYQRIAGQADKPMLVFLHEGLGCIAMWKDFPQRLCSATGYPGLVYDRLGYGESTALPAPRALHYLHDHALDELPRVLAALLPDQRYIVVGHSDGGSIALIHAAQRPPRLLGSIVEAAHIYVEAETLEGLRAARVAWEAGRMRGLAKYHGNKTDDLFHAWNDTWLAEWFRHWNLEYLLPAIDTPTLVLQGGDDQYATAAHVAAIARAPHAQAHIIDGCGHAPHQESPDQVTALMQAFIERLTDSESAALS